MKPQSLHSHEDTLLDFAYGELPPAEMRAVEDHLAQCTHCTETLDGIRGVRLTMSHLKEAPAPDAGLDSLLAYAEQAARRAQAGPAPKETWWRKLLVPVSATAAVCLVAVIGVQVSKETDLAALPEKNLALEQRQSPYASSLTPAAEKAAEKEKGFFELEALEGAPAADTGTSEDWGNAGGTRTMRDFKMDGPAKPNAPAPQKKATSTKDAVGYGQVKEIAGSSSRTTRGPGAEDDAAPQKPLNVAPNAPPPAQLAKQEAREEKRAKVESKGEGRVAMNSAPAREPPDAEGPKLSLSGAGRAPAAPSAAAADEPRFGSADVAESDFYEASVESESTGSAYDSARSRRVRRQESRSSPLSDAAWAAYRQGDRAEEAKLLRQALASGVSGSERAGLLNRLCDAEYALGEVASAEKTCNLVLSEFPNSGAASVARRRLANESGAPASAPAETHSQ